MQEVISLLKVFQHNSFAEVFRMQYIGSDIVNGLINKISLTMS